jgi:hypothetical protein
VSALLRLVHPPHLLGDLVVLRENDECIPGSPCRAGLVLGDKAHRATRQVGQITFSSSVECILSVFGLRKEAIQYGYAVHKLLTYSRRLDSSVQLKVEHTRAAGGTYKRPQRHAHY